MACFRLLPPASATPFPPHGLLPRHCLSLWLSLWPVPYYLYFLIFYIFDALASGALQTRGRLTLSELSQFLRDRRPLTGEHTFQMPTGQSRVFTLNHLLCLAITLRTIIFCPNHPRSRQWTTGDHSYNPEAAVNYSNYQTTQS